MMSDNDDIKISKLCQNPSKRFIIKLKPLKMRIITNETLVDIDPCCCCCCCCLISLSLSTLNTRGFYALSTEAVCTLDFEV